MSHYHLTQSLREPTSPDYVQRTPILTTRNPEYGQNEFQVLDNALELLGYTRYESEKNEFYWYSLFSYKYDSRIEVGLTLWECVCSSGEAPHGIDPTPPSNS